MFKRCSKRALKLLALLVVSAALFACLERIRGQMCLASYRRELAAKGEKLVASELREFVPPEENGIPAFNAGVKELSVGAALVEQPPPRMERLASGRAIVGFRESEWIENGVTNDWRQVGMDLQANQAALERLRGALAMPRLNNSLSYSPDTDLRLPHRANAKSLCGWFGAQCQLALREGRNIDARSSLTALAKLPRPMEEDRLLISELVRMAIATIANAYLWEATQSEVLTEGDWAAIQGEWANQTFVPNLARGLDGDRFFSDSSYDSMRASNQEAIKALYGLEEWFPVDEFDRSVWERMTRRLPGGEMVADAVKRQIYCRFWRFAWSHQAQCRGMKTIQRVTEIVRRASTNQSIADVRAELDAVAFASLASGLYDRLRFPLRNSDAALSLAVKRALRAETERSMAVCAIALKRYSLRHGRHPESLEALVPEFLAAVPQDHMVGQALKYRVQGGDHFMLYSVGEDGSDDGGDAAPVSEKATRRNAWERKDFVWPQPASPEELEGWRQDCASRDQP